MFSAAARGICLPPTAARPIAIGDPSIIASTALGFGFASMLPETLPSADATRSLPCRRMFVALSLLIAAPAGAEDQPGRRAFPGDLATLVSIGRRPWPALNAAAGDADPGRARGDRRAGELNLPGDAASRTSGFCLRLADKTVCPLHIDQGTVVREFGKIVFFRFYATLPARVADQAGLAMAWGDDLRCPNILVPAIRADPARQADYREIIFSPAAGAKPGTEERQLDLTVVVDRQASRYRLLYLLPILLVLAAACCGPCSSSPLPPGEGR